MMAVVVTKNAAMPNLDEIYAQAESLAPDDRLRLATRLWESLPSDLQSAPDAFALSSIKQCQPLSDKKTAASFLSGLFDRYLSKQSSDAPALYAAPRRFDLASIFAVTAAYSLLFTGLALLDAGPTTKLVIGSFITIVGIGQPLLEDRINPRGASILVGAAAGLLFAVIVWWNLPDAQLIAFTLLIAIGSFLGGACGYLAGALVAGVFLVADLLRSRRVRLSSVPSPPISHEIDPHD